MSPEAADGAHGESDHAEVRVGVLALQGDVREHEAVLRGLGAHVVRVRRPADLEGLDALVLPGGESSVIDRLSRLTGLRDPLRERIRDGLPVLGTCAGLILLADRILDAAPGQETLGGLDVLVRRNAFGTQTDSFETALVTPAFDGPPVRSAFIRAPLVEQVGGGTAGRNADVEVLASLPDGRVVGVRQGDRIGLAFHPEVTGEDRFHRLLLEATRGRADNGARGRTARDMPCARG
ncbi:pyridoxal 5'-phosphate synthase glutaminase subunit PdxT [Brachybacterium halotolerans subsp. kimchii]|uniref:pyridoxal 5'-phosphate synthase glutaminase subunit PdxT n=1 Tax=Brachybacterium halotolerans TaxID=2795215 RepID=UPI001E4EA44C|nr:pyridoxal 5'-phosphate synthase glutaminase subunit PdxT [Brachybacterium halotolerans]UEJ81419.1 pyridoxal 5'-phosphate synthase glutaminase subunit PdxT [Brachybacterium halotolerans subsp. kimchii]